jgi:hypothetical protein
VRSRSAFGRPEGRAALERYTTGLLTTLPNKNGDTIAQAVPGTSAQRLQEFLTTMHWDAEDLNRQRVQKMAREATSGEGICLVRFASGHLLHMGRVDEKDGDSTFQEVIHRAPGLACTCHGDMRVPRCGQPVGRTRRSRVSAPNSLTSLNPSACRPVGSGVTRQAITVLVRTSAPRNV